MPETPEDIDRTVEELRVLARRLDVTNTLSAYRATMQLPHNKPEAKNAHFFLLKLNPAKRALDVETYGLRQSEIANAQYFEAERELANVPGGQAALVTVDSLEALEEAYPNFFLDTHRFLQLIDTFLGPQRGWVSGEPNWEQTR